MRRLILCILLMICARATAGVADHLPPNLRTIPTDHYLIHTDLDPELANDLAKRMDVMWNEYARRLCDFAPSSNGPKLEAYLFARRRDYMRLTGDRFPNTGGIFIPSENLLAVYLEEQGRDGIRRTLQHEAFHQFALGAIGNTFPIWLNEGIAQIFEEGIWTGKEFLIGQVPPNRVQQLSADIRENRLTDFATFLNRTDVEWSSNLRYKPIARTQYNQAWAMAQFLIYAADENGHPKYRDRLLDMLRSIHSGVPGHAAFTNAFSDNTTGFQRLFNEWAHNLSPTAQATYTEHQAMLADMFITLDASGRTFQNIASFRQCLDDGGYRLKTGNSIDLSPTIFFCDLTGKTLSPAQLFLSPAPGAPAPDIVCQPLGDFTFRTHFVRGSTSNLDYETIVESR